MKITQKILAGLGVVALTAGSIIGTSAPAKAQGGALQWRSTTCIFNSPGNNYHTTGPCHAGYATDMRVRAIKFWDAPNNSWMYNEVGQQGVGFAHAPECLNVYYTNGQESFCTTRSAYQLGIRGD